MAMFFGPKQNKDIIPKKNITWCKLAIKKNRQTIDRPAVQKEQDNFGLTICHMQDSGEKKSIPYLKQFVLISESWSIKHNFSMFKKKKKKPLDVQHKKCHETNNDVLKHAQTKLFGAELIYLFELTEVQWNRMEQNEMKLNQNKQNRAKVCNHAKMSNHFYAAQLNCTSKLTFYTIVYLFQITKDYVSINLPKNSHA